MHDPSTSRRRHRRLRRATSGLAALALAAGGLAAAAVTLLAAPAAPAAAASTPGASVPFTEYNAVNASTNGTVLGPNYYFGTLASEATGRQVVLLSGQGEYVQFTLTAPANAADFHYAIPDSASGACERPAEPVCQRHAGHLAAADLRLQLAVWLVSVHQHPE